MAEGRHEEPHEPRPTVHRRERHGVHPAEGHVLVHRPVAALHEEVAALGRPVRAHGLGAPSPTSYPRRFEHGGLVQCLARTEQPDLSTYTAPEVVGRVDHPHHGRSRPALAQPRPRARTARRLLAALLSGSPHGDALLRGARGALTASSVSTCGLERGRRGVASTGPQRGAACVARGAATGRFSSTQQCLRSPQARARWPTSRSATGAGGDDPGSPCPRWSPGQALVDG